MNANFPRQSLSVHSILCSAFGHRFKVSNKITNHISEFKCERCGQEVTNVISGDIEILTFKNRRINVCLSEFFKKKLQHTSAH